jgi:hypothetical protein
MEILETSLSFHIRRGGFTDEVGGALLLKKDFNSGSFVLSSHFKTLTANVSVCVTEMSWFRRLIASLSLMRPISIPGHSVWDLWWRKWHWDKFLSRYYSFIRPYNLLPMLHVQCGTYDNLTMPAALSP